MSTKTKVAGSYLLHPIVLLSLFLWIINDHMLKAVWPGIVTGKLSDVVSLIVFPLLLLALVERLWWRIRKQALSPRRVRRTLHVAVFATGFVMATINSVDAAANAYRWGLGTVQWPIRGLVALSRGAELPSIAPVQLWMDLSDLVTLPALVVPVLLLSYLFSPIESRSVGR